MSYLTLNEINSNEKYAPIGYEKQFIKRVRENNRRVKAVLKHYLHEYQDTEGGYCSGLYESLPFGYENYHPDNKKHEPKITLKNGLIDIKTEKFIWNNKDEIIREIDWYMTNLKRDKCFYGYSFSVYEHTINHGRPTKRKVKNYTYSTKLF